MERCTLSQLSPSLFLVFICLSLCFLLPACDPATLRSSMLPTSANPSHGLLLHPSVPKAQPVRGGPSLCLGLSAPLSKFCSTGRLLLVFKCLILLFVLSLLAACLPPATAATAIPLLGRSCFPTQLQAGPRQAAYGSGYLGGLLSVSYV